MRDCTILSASSQTVASGEWDYSASIVDGRLRLLLAMPSFKAASGADPYLNSFDTAGTGRSVYRDVHGEDGGAEAVFSLATVTDDRRVTVESWEFGHSEDDGHTLVLSCPADR